VYKYSPSKERNEWKVRDNHLDASMDDTSSLPTTNIINLSYDRSKCFLVFFFFKKKKQIIKGKDLQRSRINGTNTTKDQTQAIKSNSLWVPSVSHTQVRREKKETERKGSRRGSLVESLKSSMKEEDNRVVVRIKTHINRGQKQGGRLFIFFFNCVWVLFIIIFNLKNIKLIYFFNISCYYIYIYNI